METQITEHKRNKIKINSTNMLLSTTEQLLNNTRGSVMKYFNTPIKGSTYPKLPFSEISKKEKKDTIVLKIQISPVSQIGPGLF